MQFHGLRAIAVVFACGAALATQAPPARPAEPDKDKDLVGQAVTRHLRINLRFAEPGVTPGAQATLVAEVVPAPRMHVYAPGQQNYISVELKLAASPNYKPAAPAFPAPKALYLEAIRESVQVYDAPFRITQVVTLADTPDLRRRAAARETLAIAGTLRYQACDDTVCYRPETTPVSWKVALARAK